jgi:hypothetical protein
LTFGILAQSVCLVKPMERPAAIPNVILGPQLGVVESGGILR